MQGEFKNGVLYLSYVLVDKIINSIEQEYSKIFNRLASKDGITIYEGQHLFNVLKELQDACEELSEINFDLQVFQKDYNKFLIRFALLLCLCGILGVTAPLLGIIIGICCAKILHDSYVSIDKKHQEYQNFLDGLEERYRKISIINGNCVRLLNRKLDDRKEEVTKELTSTYDLSKENFLQKYAQYILDYYLISKKVYPNIPSEVESYLEGMLQENLASDEGDIAKLLEMTSKNLAENNDEFTIIIKQKHGARMLKFNKLQKKLTRKKGN